ncbi:MAG: hypothetical protein ACKVP7_10510 [Hyphomicrobiaceae bacterium]
MWQQALARRLHAAKQHYPASNPLHRLTTQHFANLAKGCLVIALAIVAMLAMLAMQRTLWSETRSYEQRATEVIKPRRSFSFSSQWYVTYTFRASNGSYHSGRDPISDPKPFMPSRDDQRIRVFYVSWWPELNQSEIGQGNMLWFALKLLLLAIVVRSMVRFYRTHVAPLASEPRQTEIT